MAVPQKNRLARLLRLTAAASSGSAAIVGLASVAYVTIEGNTNTLSTAIGGAIGGQNDF